MLAVKRNGSEIEMVATILIPGAGFWNYSLKRSESGVPTAAFVTRAIEQMVFDHLQRERENWYEQGWRDAKAKKGLKRSWFPRCWSWMWPA